MSRSATAEAARRFVAVWQRAWTAHDVDTIVGLFDVPEVTWGRREADLPAWG